jgi:ABC-type branched-subunit amino acid transport system ATPase component
MTEQGPSAAVGGAASLVAQVIAEEESRHAEARQQADVLPDDLLPGAQGEPMSVRAAVHVGGLAMITLLTMLLVVEEFDRAAVTVFGPEIQKALDISDTTLIGLSSLGGVVLVLATIPMAALGDRMHRTRVLGVCTVVWAAFVALTGRVVNPFQMALTRMGSGFGSSANIPLSPSLITDQYPMQSRVRMLAVEGLGRTTGQVFGPLAAGGLAVALGNHPDDWRTVLLIFAIPAFALGLLAFLLREPARGKVEQVAVLGEVLEINDPPVRISAVFQRLKKVRTYYFMVTGIGVLGFALVAVPGLMSLLLKNEARYGYGPYRRGWIFSVSLLGQFVAVPIAAYIGERVFRQDPPRLLRIMGAFVVLYGIFMTISLRMHPPVLLVGFWALANTCLGVAFVTMRPAIAAIVPYRMRSQAFALVGVYIFLMGGFFGGLLGGAISDATSERTALSVIVLPAAAIGGFLIVYGSRFMRSDISLCVLELREERDERDRMSADPENTPVLQVRNLDASYGPVQVLFNVELEVKRGETLALLGTNGAGKSTLLRCISGILMPDRGVVRLNGRTITFVAPELRVGLGMVQVPGGEALFNTMTVRENLEIWSRLIEDPGEREQRIERVTRVFPDLVQRMDQRAGSMSGGQQQMLALGKALMLDPAVLLIDELSLGLAPVVVQELIAVVERLKSEGVTMVIVEQSVNIALALADTAIFMERGQVRYQGPAQQLLERDDLLRAVFLSGAGA